MKYETPAAFRDALLTRLRNQAAKEGGSLDRLRKRVVFERLLARLQEVAHGRWALKGALALDFRSPAHARATMDADLVTRVDLDQMTEDLASAQGLDLKDYFVFQIRQVGTPRDAPEPSVRFHVTAQIAGSTFDEGTLDVAVGAPVAAELETVSSHLLAFADLPAVSIPVIPPEVQAAEKLHAYTRAYGERQAPSTRVKDLVDLVVMITTLPLDAAALSAACTEVFSRRRTHPLPQAVPPPPADWGIAFRAAARAVDIPTDLTEAHRLVAACLDPVIAGTVTSGRWDPRRHRWQS